MNCTNNTSKDLKQVLKMYEHTKYERDILQNIVSETIHYLIKQIALYENENGDREIKVLSDVINKMKDIETKSKKITQS